MNVSSQYAHYKLSVEDIMHRYNWSDIANGIEVRPGSDNDKGTTSNRCSVSSQIRQWDMRDKALKEFLILSLPSEWKGKFDNITGGGFDLWQAIVNEFEQEALKEHTTLLASLYNLSQGNAESLDDYTGRLKAILKNLQKVNQSVSNTTTVMCFFNGLNATYKPEDVSILLEQQLTLDQAVCMVQEFEINKPNASVRADILSGTSPLNNSFAPTVVVAVPIEKSNSATSATIAAPPMTSTTTPSASIANSTRTVGSRGSLGTIATTTSTSSTQPGASGAPRTAFELTSLNRGLKNNYGEHNCFLNVTIQALWHLGPFRAHLTSFIQEHASRKHSRVPTGGILEALCHLFVQYEFTEQTVLPATELRDSLAALSDHFKLGEIADANEALDVILQRIHTELCDTCPQEHKCLSHEVFGGCIMEQSVCLKCHATSEPMLRSDFILCFQAAELLLEAKALFAKFSHDDAEQDHILPAAPTAHGVGRMVPHLPPIPNLSRFLGCARRHQPLAHQADAHSHPGTHPTHSGTVNSAIHHPHDEHSAHHYANTEFGHILSKCMQLNHKSCPSRGAIFSQKMAKHDNISGAVAVPYEPYECTGRAKVHQFSLDPPLAIALSVGM